METKKINACGLSCPQPVLLTKEAIEKNSLPIQVVVDTQCAMENIFRLADNMRLNVEVTTEDDQFRLTLSQK